MNPLPHYYSCDCCCCYTLVLCLSCCLRTKIRTSPRRPSVRFFIFCNNFRQRLDNNSENFVRTTEQKRRYIKWSSFCLLLIALKDFCKHQKKSLVKYCVRWRLRFRISSFWAATKKDLNPDKCDVDLLFKLWCNAFKYYTAEFSGREKPYNIS